MCVCVCVCVYVCMYVYIYIYICIKCRHTIRSRLGVGGAKCIGSYGRKGVPPAPCNFGAS